jgi:hypothetical protein
MNNTIFYLIGEASAGRAAVAREIAARTGARIIDSEAIYAPIFNLVEHRGPAHMPDGVWTQVDAVREAILATIETISPAEWNFVFTHAGLDIPADVGVYRRVRATALRRKARFHPVRFLHGATRHPLLAFDEADARDVDVTARTPTEAAELILEAAGG